MARYALAKRRLQGEIMDSPALDPRHHADALTGLARLNALSGAARRLWRQIALHARVKPGERLRVVDVASGGGDLAWGLWTQARRAGVALEIRGIDVSSTACAFAARRCRAAGAAIRFERADALADPIPGADVAISSLFLHHLPHEQAAALLGKMAAAAPLVVISDLRRSPLGYCIAQAACHVATRSRVVWHDGPRSVASAFTLAEARQLCRDAGLPGARVERAWPWRFLLTYRSN